MTTQLLTHPEAQEEVKEALLSFLQDNHLQQSDASTTLDDGFNVHYSQQALKDVLVVIMDAFGFQMVDEK